MGGMGGGMGGGNDGRHGRRNDERSGREARRRESIRLPAEKSVNSKSPPFAWNTASAIRVRRSPMKSVRWKRSRPSRAWPNCSTLLGNGRIDQRGAQAAAWHLANGMSWEQLAQKRIQTLLGDGGSYFTPDQIASGVGVAQVSVDRWQAIRSTQSRRRARRAPAMPPTPATAATRDRQPPSR